MRILKRDYFFYFLGVLMWHQLYFFHFFRIDIGGYTDVFKMVSVLGFAIVFILSLYACFLFFGKKSHNHFKYFWIITLVLILLNAFLLINMVISEQNESLKRVRQNRTQKNKQ